MTPRGRRRPNPTPSGVADDATGDGEPGVIVAHRGVAVDVELADGERRSVRVRRRSGHVVGDRVLVTGERLVRLTRDNELLRRSPGGGVHVVCANLDLLCIVLAAEPPPRLGLVDRAAVAARARGIAPTLVFNKVDIDGAEDVLDVLREVFEDAMPVLGVSAETGAGVDALAKHIAAHGRAVLAGHSGVGKSSLTNHLVPGAKLRTSDLSDASGRGRHTTSVATLHKLPNGGALIDTAGIKEFGLVEVSPADLAYHFVGFERVRDEPCKFRNCLHKGEPGCAVVAAVAEGLIDEERLDAYRALLEEIETGNDPRA